MNDPDKLRSSLVVKSNALINAMHDMGLQEMRFLAFAVSQLPRGLDPERETPYDMEINIQALAKTFKMEEKSAYREVKILADKLMKKIIEFDDKAGCEVAVGLISKRKYHSGEGRLWFRFDEDLLPHLIGLKAQYSDFYVRKFKEGDLPNN